jgi:phosphoribosylformimino-5-aminoimidazole carboxamide ribotide isomerase
MTRFRPCIDLHAGQVKQIVGGTLSTAENDLKTNFVSALPAGQFAKLYRDNDALGAHVIMLGRGNEDAAKEALSVWPGHLQIGGGINDENAKEWIDAGAEKVGLSISSANSGIIGPKGSRNRSSFFSLLGCCIDCK